MGSHDNTLKICQEYNTEVVNIEFEKDYSKARNEIVENSSTDWQFYIDPWEELKSGHDDLLWYITKNNSYKIYKIQGDILTKQTRLWKKSLQKFIRPTYEGLYPELDEEVINCVICGNKDSNKEKMEILLEWQKNQPHTPNIDYYISCTYLTSGHYDQFIRHAEKFLFAAKQSTATLLTNYYLAYVFLWVKNKPTECVNRIIHCLSYQPTMAEFWCLLGDVFFQMGQWGRASIFYHHAIKFGSKRINNDPFPIEINKYQEYPQEMIALCDVNIKKVYQSH